MYKEPICLYMHNVHGLDSTWRNMYMQYVRIPAICTHTGQHNENDDSNPSTRRVRQKTNKTINTLTVWHNCVCPPVVWVVPPFRAHRQWSHGTQTYASGIVCHSTLAVVVPLKTTVILWCHGEKIIHLRGSGPPCKSNVLCRGLLRPKSWSCRLPVVNR